ncbi:DNA (cytosine-5)-methyltransferase 1 [Microdochium nivale]|nr:DNA (cytosine-5)-methyltransferase 1 [Microdochium nivale]
MPRSIISISSDSGSDDDDDDVPLTRSHHSACPTTVRLDDLDGSMDWEAVPTNATTPESAGDVKLRVRSPERLALTQPTIVSLDLQDNDLMYGVLDDGLTAIRPSLSVTESALLANRAPGKDLDRSTSLTGIDPGHMNVFLPKSTLVNPESSFEGFTPPAQQISERQALELIERDVKHDPESEYMEIKLHNFCIYVDSKVYRDELRPLQALGTDRNSLFYFDGQIRIGNQDFFLKKIPFSVLPIGGYDSVFDTVRTQIWIHSALNIKRGRELYYRLGKPSTGYERFFTPFIWIADLTKHFLDYCELAQLEKRSVVLEDFKARFHAHVVAKHHGSATAQKWASDNGSSDFRAAVVSNANFIWKEVKGVADELLCHTVWREIRSLDHFEPNLATMMTVSDSHHTIIQRTTVTPYIYKLFEHFDFGSVFEPISPCANVENARSIQVANNARYTTRDYCTRSMRRSTNNDESVDFAALIQPGDVVSTHMDSPDKTTTSWKLEPSVHHEEHHVWMARVQRVHIHPTTRARSFDVLWLYHPRDTSCGRMKYPWKKELFLSDNCTCHSGGLRLAANEIIAIHEVEWFAGETTTADFFIRQIYLPSQNRWERLQEFHLDCDIEGSIISDLRIGDTVLGPAPSSENCLEPFVIETLYTDDRGQTWAAARKLGFIVDKNSSPARANELHWTSATLKLRVSRIQRRCYIRVLNENEEVPAPYDRNGTGNLFYIRRTTSNATELKIIRQGFDPHATIVSPLRGLDLFCGGGNFGRGLEEGGAVQMQWANDLAKQAIHTYMANSTQACQPFLGSIDDLLRQIIQGSPGAPKPGDVDFISGGSPCPGFSNLTQNKDTAEQQKNRSLTAAFAAAVDCLRPQFGVLENVKQIVERESKKDGKDKKNRKDSCVLSQLICALVGLGYQTQLMWLDAWSFGAPQSRERVFLCFASPGTALPRMPEPSHSHPPWVKMERLGKMSNGEPYGQRENVRTPFRYVTASVATADLPDVQDGKADYCVGFPDHRLSSGYTPSLRKQLSLVPMRPYGLNISKIAFGHDGDAPMLPISKRRVFPRRAFVAKGVERAKNTSNAWGRIHPHRLFGTVTTDCKPTDAVVGTWSHWAQNRPITVLEARRAQGFLDHEVILGSPKDQWKIVGNSVSRHVALALGLAFREAWMGTLLDEKHAA